MPKDDISPQFFKKKISHIALLERFNKQQEKKLDKMNQKVMIRDLVMRAECSDYSYGEVEKYKNTYLQSSNIRLRAHIRSLFNLVNEDHRAHYCEKLQNGTYKLKEEKANSITRLSMNEFSLYKDKPLSLHEFQNLFSDIEHMAETLEPNVHVLLSSFSVVMKDNNLLNICLFIEGGKPPIIHTFSKNTPSYVDCTYTKPTYHLFAQQTLAKKPTFQTAYSNSNDVTISMCSVFGIKTYGGASYTQAIDICLDHKYQHAKTLFKRDLLQEEEWIPEQVEQCVTSASIDIYENSKIAREILHADNLESMQVHHKALTDAGRLSKDAKNKIIPCDYKKMKIKNNAIGYRIINPCFGSTCIIECLKERPASRYIPELDTEVIQHNQHLIKTKVRKANHHLNHTDFNTINTIHQTFEALEKLLLKACKFGFLQTLFRTEEYKQKKQAKNIIQQSFDFIKEAIDTHGDDSLLMIHAWKKELDDNINDIGTLPVNSPLKIKLKGHIETFMQDLSKALKVESKVESVDDSAPRAK